MRVAAGELPPTFRLHRPGRILAFSKQDAASQGFPDAVATARALLTADELAELCLDVSKWSTQKVHVALGTDSADRLPLGADGVSFFRFGDDGRVAGFSARPDGG